APAPAVDAADPTEKVEKFEPDSLAGEASVLDAARGGWTEKSGEIKIARAHATEQPVESGPSILIEDLAAAHAAAATAVTAAAGKPAPRKREPTPPPHAAHGDVARVRADAAKVAGHATHFTDDEEAFFQQGHEELAGADAHETFTDLDEGYEPQTFWERLTGKKPVKKRGPSS